MKTAAEAKKAGMKFVGEFGRPGFEETQIYATPESFDDVKAAYDAIPDDDLGQDVLSDVLAAGGVYVIDK